MQNLEVAEVVLIQYYLADNQKQQKFEVLYTFTSKKIFWLFLKHRTKQFSVSKDL